MSDAQSSAISSDQHTTTAAQRLLSTDHPAGFFLTAGIEVVFFAALGAWLMTRNVGGGVLVVVVGLVVGGRLRFRAGGQSDTRRPRMRGSPNSVRYGIAWLAAIRRTFWC